METHNSIEEGISTHCPICMRPVTKVVSSDKKPDCELDCESEYYYHAGSKLIKIKHPVGAWEQNAGKENAESLPN